MKLLSVLAISTVTLVAFSGSVTQSAHAAYQDWEQYKCVYKHNNDVYDEQQLPRFGQCMDSTAEPEPHLVNVNGNIILKRDHKECLLTTEILRK